MKYTGIIVRAILYFIVAFSFFDLKAQSWMRIENVDTVDFLSVTEQGSILYAASSAAVFKSTDGGNKWQRTEGQPAASSDIYSLFPFREYMYAGTLGNGVYRSSDDGKSWEGFSAGLPSGRMGSIVAITALDDTLFAGTGGSGIYMYELSDTSAVWREFNDGLFQMGVNSISLSAENVVAGVGFYLFIRPKRSLQWKDVYIDSLSMQVQIYETLQLNNYLFAGTDRGIYRGTSDGAEWKKTDIKVFPGKDVVALVRDGSRLYAGINYSAQHWIFSSDDFGLSWEIRAHEFSDLADLFIARGRIWAARADGLWYYPLDVWSSAEGERIKSFGYSLKQNYPNPFNPSTTIEYELPKEEYVRLMIYDLTGREVRLLSDGMQSAGKHKISYTPDGLSSGIYFYQLKAGSFSQIMPMILIK